MWAREMGTICPFGVFPLFRARKWPFQAPKTLRFKGKMANFEATSTVKQGKNAKRTNGTHFMRVLSEHCKCKLLARSPHRKGPTEKIWTVKIAGARGGGECSKIHGLGAHFSWFGSIFPAWGAFSRSTRSSTIYDFRSRWKSAARTSDSGGGASKGARHKEFDHFFSCLVAIFWPLRHLCINSCEAPSVARWFGKSNPNRKSLAIELGCKLYAYAYPAIHKLYC